MREQIQWQQQPFSHNQGCLDLIAAKPHGILRILDDQCNFPQVHTWLTKPNSGDINGKSVIPKNTGIKNTPHFSYWISYKPLKCFTANQYGAITHTDLIPTQLLLSFS